MGKFSSQEIETQYKLIKVLLAEPEKYKDAINAIKKDIAYMPIEIKKKLEEENITLWIKNLMHMQFSFIYYYFAMNRLRPNLTNYALSLLQDIDWLYKVRVNLTTLSVVGIYVGISC